LNQATHSKGLHTPDAARPLHRADTDVVAGSIGMLTFLRDTDRRVVGFEFADPEHLTQRVIRFARCGACGWETDHGGVGRR
jgi:hypothetical protein